MSGAILMTFLRLPDQHHSRKSSRRKKHSHQVIHVEESASESVWLTTLQVFVPFLVAGLGMVGAGLVLDVVQVRPIAKLRT